MADSIMSIQQLVVINVHNDLETDPISAIEWYAENLELQATLIIVSVSRYSSQHIQLRFATVHSHAGLRYSKLRYQSQFDFSLLQSCSHLR